MSPNSLSGALSAADRANAAKMKIYDTQAAQANSTTGAAVGGSSGSGSVPAQGSNTANIGSLGGTRTTSGTNGANSAGSSSDATSIGSGTGYPASGIQTGSTVQPGAVVQISQGAQRFAQLLALAKQTPEVRPEVVAAARQQSGQELSPTEVTQLASRLLGPNPR